MSASNNLLGERRRVDLLEADKMALQKEAEGIKSKCRHLIVLIEHFNKQFPNNNIYPLVRFGASGWRPPTDARQLEEGKRFAASRRKAHLQVDSCLCWLTADSIVPRVRRWMSSEASA